LIDPGPEPSIEPGPVRAPLVDSATRDGTLLLAERIRSQLLHYHGCQAHGGGGVDGAEDVAQAGDLSSPLMSLTDVTRWECPDVLGEKGMSAYPADWDVRFPRGQRRLLFTGIPAETPSPAQPEENLPPPPQVSIERDETTLPDHLSVTLDIDSAGGFASSLAVARQGLRWTATRPPVSNLTSSLHLDPIPVQFEDHDRGEFRSTQAPVHRVPHLPLGRFYGYEAIELYVLFPQLYHPSREHWIITDDEFKEWSDLVFLPALHAALPSSIVQHLPATADDIKAKAGAAFTESVTRSCHTSRIQLLQYMIQPEYLGRLWSEALRRVHRYNLRGFFKPRLLLTAKNLKTETAHADWTVMYAGFFRKWNAAVDARFLTFDFYDIGKEVLAPGRSYHCQEEQETAAFTLSWRRCCLVSLGDWLLSCDRELREIDMPPPAASQQPQQWQNRLRPSRQAHLRQTADVADSDSDRSRGMRDSSSPSSASESSAPRSTARSDSGSGSRHRDPPCLKQELFPLSLLADAGGMTVEPTRRSHLRKSGLLYGQLYNSSKEIFDASKTYPFTNSALDTLAVDPALLRAWQHIGRAVSHNPTALLRAYLHSKWRCHVALEGSKQRQYGLREEYRVTGPLLHTIHQGMPPESPECLARPRYLLPTSEATTSPRPFFCLHTADMVRWLRWNINRLCLGFEMVWSLHPRSMVHWEHTRVMMLFLRALPNINSGQPRRCNALWLDRRQDPADHGSDGPRIQEGIGLQVTMEKYRYGWFLDKIDWGAMVFLPQVRDSICLRGPSMLASYRVHYRKLISINRRFVFAHEVFSRLESERHDQAKVAMLLQVLIDLCLCTFRQDVFAVISESPVSSLFNQHRLQEALDGRVPLTARGFRRVFGNVTMESQIRLIDGKNLRVNHIDVLFSWLWGWERDGNNGDWPRIHWDQKPYRVLARQCFDVISQIYGLRQAWEWRFSLRQTFIRTHWLLPYPDKRSLWSRSSLQDGDSLLRTWCSTHRGVVAYFQHRSSNPALAVQQDIRPEQVCLLPVSGWIRGSTPLLFKVILPLIPTDLDEFLTMARSSSTRYGRSPTQSGSDLPYRAIGTLDSPLIRYIRENTPEQRKLRSQTQADRGSRSTLDDQWLTIHLPNMLDGLTRAFKQEGSSLDLPTQIRSWQQQQFEQSTQDLLQLNRSLALEDLEEDSEGDSLAAKQRYTIDQCNRTRYLARYAAKHVKGLKTAKADLAELENHPQNGMTQEQWNALVRQKYRPTRAALNKERQKLVRVWEELEQAILPVQLDRQYPVTGASHNEGINLKLDGF